MFNIGVLNFDRQVIADHPDVVADVREFINCPSVRIDFLGFRRDVTYLAACPQLPAINAGERVPRYELEIAFGGGDVVNSVDFVG